MAELTIDPTTIRKMISYMVNRLGNLQVVNL